MVGKKKSKYTISFRKASIIFLILALMLFIIKGASYFSFDKYLSFIILLVFLLIFIIAELYIKGGKFRILNNKYINYVFFGFIIYFILSSITTVYLRITIEETILWFIGVSLTLFIINSIKTDLDINPLIYGFIFIGLILSVVPFLHQINPNIFKGSIIRGRFASFFQYPNTFSSFLFIPIFFSIFKYEETKSSFFSFASALLSITFFLTKSRASLILLLLLIILSIFFIKKNKFKVINDEVFLLIFIPLLYLFLSSISNFLIALSISLFLSYIYGLFSFRIRILSSFYPLLILVFASVIFLRFSSSEFLSRFLSLFSIETYKGVSGLSGRNALMLTALRIFKSHPIFGSGPGTYKFVYFKYRPTMIFSKFPHSTPFQLLSETGIIGFILYSFLLYFIFRKIYSLLKTDKYLFIGFSLAFLGVLLHTFIDFDLSIPAMFYIFFVLMGVLFSLNLRKKDTRFIEVKKVLPYASIIFIVIIFLNIFFIFGANFYNKGRNFLNAGSYNYAKKPFAQSILLDPLNSDYHHALGLTYERLALKEKDLNYLRKAKEEIEKAVKLNPKFFLYHASLGEIYLQLNEKERCIDELKEAIALNPIDYYNYINLASAYERFEMRDSAIEMYKKALELKPQDKRIIKKLILLNDKETKEKYVLIEIEYPKGGETFRAGDKIKIKWNVVGNLERIDHFTLKYSNDLGKDYSVIDFNIDGSLREYIWNVPMEASDSCVILILARDKNNNVIDFNRTSPFSIKR